MASAEIMSGLWQFENETGKSSKALTGLPDFSG
jgi:hypothetical protein